MKVSVAVALPDRQEVIELDVPEGATAADAIARADLARRHPSLDLARCKLGVWSRVVDADAPLREGDRVEVYRQLRADAKQMRRTRARAKPSSRSRNGP